MLLKSDDDSLWHLVSQLKRSVDNPSDGLPDEIFQFVSGLTPLVNVDLLITDPQAGVLLTWRPAGNYPAGWHIPGGIIRLKEKFEDRVRKVALSELRVNVLSFKGPIKITEMIHPEAETRVHFISLLYKVKIEGSLDDSLKWQSGVPRPGQWYWHEEWPKNMYGPQSEYTNLQLSKDLENF